MIRAKVLYRTVKKLLLLFSIFRDEPRAKNAIWIGAEFVY